MRMMMGLREDARRKEHCHMQTGVSNGKLQVVFGHVMCCRTEKLFQVHQTRNIGYFCILPT